MQGKRSSSYNLERTLLFRGIELSVPLVRYPHEDQGLTVLVDNVMR